MQQFHYALPLTSASGNTLFLPYYATGPIPSAGSTNKNVQTIHILQHGMSGDANQYIWAAYTSFQSQIQSGSLILISPWLGSQSITGNQWG